MRHALRSPGEDPRWALMNRNTKIKKVEKTKFLGDAPKTAQVSYLCLVAEHTLLIRYRNANWLFQATLLLRTSST